MPAPYSKDLRQRVVDAYKAKLGSQRQLAERFQGVLIVRSTLDTWSSKDRRSERQAS